MKHYSKKLKSRPKAIIFDMDGVIVDSMPYHFLAWYEALRPLGVRVSCFEVYAKEGENWQKTLIELLGRAGIEPTKKLLTRIFLARSRIFKKYFKRFIFQGAPQFLFCLKNQGYSLGLVTGTPMQEVNRILPSKMRALFDAIITGDQVLRGKPFADPYLKAIRVLGLGKRDCIVVENAPLGIESAKRAGLFCIALTTGLPQEYLKKADLILERLQDITGFIDKKCSFK
jgi:beta-phosphoglucomutase